MAHYQEDISEHDRSRFSHLLAGDEEMMLLTGLSRMYLLQKFTHTLIFPGIIIVLISLGLAYFTSKNAVNPMTAILLGWLLALFIAYLSMHAIKRSVKYILTNKRVVVKKGLLKINLTSAPFDKITQIEIDQGLFDKHLFRHGTIRINIAGLDHKEIELDYVDSPLEFKNILERLIHFERGSLGGRRQPIEEVVIDE